MVVGINDILELVNVDNSSFREMKKYNDTLEDGALCVFDALKEFCDCQLEQYEKAIPYDKLFCAVYQVITTACENENIRNGFLTGLLNEKYRNAILNQKVSKPNAKASEVVARKHHNQSAIALYAKNHTINEICEHFEFTNATATKSYLTYHKIPYLHTGKGASESYIEQLKELGKYMTLSQIAKTLGKTKHAVCMFCMRHDINYVGKGEK